MNKCNLTNQQLIEACEEEVSKMCKTGGRSFTMRVPVNFEKDTDMLLSELNQRFKHAIEDIKELRKVLLSAKTFVSFCAERGGLAATHNEIDIEDLIKKTAQYEQ